MNTECCFCASCCPRFLLIRLALGLSNNADHHDDDDDVITETGACDVSCSLADESDPLMYFIWEL